MKKLVPLVLGSFLFAGSLFAQEVGDKMPLLDKKYRGSFNLKESGKHLVIYYYDRNGDEEFDQLAIYLRCDGKRSELPFEIYDRPMKKSFLDFLPVDGIIDKVVLDANQSTLSTNAPDCPR